MRLLSAELLKLRRRTATYVVLLVLFVLMVLLMGLLATEQQLMRSLLQFPSAWATVGDFVFGGLGSMIAVAYAAAIAGADWNWGVLRNVIARGESRIGYVLAKGAAVTIVLAIGVAAILLAGAALAFAITSLAGVPPGNPVAASSLEVLGRQVLFGFPVLLERAAIGFAVAIILRSQVAGVVVAIVLYVGEAFLTGLLFAATVMPRLMEGGLDRLSPQWYQYLPFAVGEQVRMAGMRGAPGADLPIGGDFAALLMGQVPLAEGLAMVAVYFGLALGLAILRVWREEVVA
ncbi:MAG TPA: ABC transporter permease [Candidatus Limnocylindrales bacterium]|nr:ABC transporter permease [Candidatus Limnocylindrales bacterium]